MGAQAFGDPSGFLDHLLNEIEPSQNAADQSDDDKKVVDTIREFLAQTPPQGRRQFLRYCVVWLYNNCKPDAVCPEIPSNHDYQTAWDDLREYQNKHGQTRKKILRCLRGFKEHIVLMCIFPMMARPGSTHSSNETSNSNSSSLRDRCLRRDGNRCVVTRSFNFVEANKRYPDLVDDDGVQVDPDHELAALEVAHIIPHALGWRDDAQPDALRPRKIIHLILDMFRPGAMARYGGGQIDVPENACTMETMVHRLFGSLMIYFEPAQGSVNNSNYVVRHIAPEASPTARPYPRNITFRQVESDVGLPDPDLFAIHRACCHVAHASGAAETAENFIRYFEDGAAVEADGSAPLGSMMTFRLALDPNMTPGHEGTESRAALFEEGSCFPEETFN